MASQSYLNEREDSLKDARDAIGGLYHAYLNECKLNNGAVYSENEPEWRNILIQTNLLHENLTRLIDRLKEINS